MTNKLALKKRRDRVLRALGKGLKLYEIAEQESVSSKAIEKDITALKKEIQERIEKQDLIDILLELTAVSEDTMRSLNALFASTESDAIKLGVKRELIKLLDTKIDLLQRLGVLKKAPLEIEVTKSDEIIKELEALDARSRELHKSQEDGFRKNVKPSGN